MNKLTISNQSSIAILLGVYNGDLYLNEQIDSLLAQTYKDWTLFIRDDDSTDSTKEIINYYCSKYENIIQVEDNDGNLGCNGNYFRLLENIDSSYYMFCNADDYWFPDKIEQSINQMKVAEELNRNTAIIVHTDLSISDKNLNITSNSYWESVNTNPEAFKSYNLAGICNVCSGATMLFNKEVKILTFPIGPNSLFFDHFMSLKIVGKGIISTLHKPTMSYRQIGTNLAAVSIGKNNNVLAKIKNIRTVLRMNKKEARMLKEIGWGNIFKYVFYKIIVLFKLRFGKKYISNSES